MPYKLIPVAIYFIVLSVLTLIFGTLGMEKELLKGIFILASMGGIFLGIMDLLE